MYWLCQLSNVSMIFPIMAAFQHQYNGVAMAITLCMVCSIIYHTDERNHALFFVDLVGVLALTTTCIYILLYGQRHLTYLNLISSIYAGIGLYFFTHCPDPESLELTDSEHREYEYYHSAWHCFVMFSIFGVSYSYINHDNEFSALSNVPLIEFNVKKVKWAKKTLKWFKLLI